MCQIVKLEFYNFDYLFLISFWFTSNIISLCYPEICIIIFLYFSDEIVLGQTTILVSVSGIVTFTGKAATLFSESFLLTAQQGATGNVWKIVSDCFRFHETVN